MPLLKRLAMGFTGFIGGIVLMVLFPFVAAHACFTKSRWIWAEVRTLD